MSILIAAVGFRHTLLIGLTLLLPMLLLLLIPAQLVPLLLHISGLLSPRIVYVSGRSGASTLTSKTPSDDDVTRHRLLARQAALCGLNLDAVLESYQLCICFHSDLCWTKKDIILSGRERSRGAAWPEGQDLIL